MESVLLDAAGHRRSAAAMPRYHQGPAPRNKGLRYPAGPPTIEKIVGVMRAAVNGADGARLRALIVILWRAGLRISEALELAETDLDPSRGAVLVRPGKGGRRREVGMDRWAWDQLQPWLEIRGCLPVGALLCVMRGADRRPVVGTRRLLVSSYGEPRSSPETVAGSPRTTGISGPSLDGPQPSCPRGVGGGRFVRSDVRQNSKAGLDR